MKDKKTWLLQLEKYKYPLLIFTVGLLLLLLPGSGEKAEAEQGRDALLQQALSSSVGVGNAHVISSESGIVIVCQGAQDAKVRLDIIHAVSSYTGFTSDKITILKMS